MSEVSIVILNWNSKHFLEPCLASLAEHDALYEQELVIVDNASQDGSLDFIRQNYPCAVLIANSTNRGVARARNQGISVARGDYIFILDVDTTVCEGAIEMLVNFMKSNPRVGICAPKLISPCNQLQYTCRLYPTLPSKVLRRIPFAWCKNFLASEEMRSWDHNSISEVDYVIGAAQLIRRRLIEEIGLYDEAIFYGPEDVDFCLRARQRGWKIVYNPEAIVMHHESRITRKLFTGLGWQHCKGLAYFFWKHRYLFSREKLYRRLRTVRPRG